MEVLRRNGNRYNMVQSTILDLLSIIWKEQIKPLLLYLGANFRADLENMQYSDVGSSLMLRYQMNL